MHPFFLRRSNPFFVIGVAWILAFMLSLICLTSLSAEERDLTLGQRLGLRAPPYQVPDFIKEASLQKGELVFLPFNRYPQEPEKQVLTPPEIRKQETELDRLRVSQDHRAGHMPEAVTSHSAADGRFTRVPKGPPPCLLTCKIE